MVVVIGSAVVCFQVVVGDGIEAVWKDIVHGVEGEQFIASFGNPAQFVVFEMRRTRPLVGAVCQVDNFVELLRLPSSPAVIVVYAHEHIYI